MEGHQKFLGGKGFLKAKILEAKYETLNWNFLWGEGERCITKNLPRVWIFSGTAQYNLNVFSPWQRPHVTLDVQLTTRAHATAMDAVSVGGDGLVLMHYTSHLGCTTTGYW